MNLLETLKRLGLSEGLQFAGEAKNGTLVVVYGDVKFKWGTATKCSVCGDDIGA